MLNQKEIVDAVAERIKDKDLSKQALGVVKRATALVLTRTQQDINGQIKDGSFPIVQRLTDRILEKFKKRTQVWEQQVNKSGPMIFPSGTRFIHQDGDVTHFIIEEQPKVRTVNIYNHKYSLAFPYVVFVFTFRNGKFEILRVGMRTKELSSLDDVLFYPNLPNNTGSHGVCYGDMLGKINSNMSVNEQIRILIGSYWQTGFTGNGTREHADFLNRNNMSVLEWEEKSKRNPLFILKCLYISGFPIKKLLDGVSSTNDTLIQGIKADFTEAIKEIGKDIEALFSNLDMKKENRDKTQLENLETILKEIIVQAYSELWEYAYRENLKERDRMEAEMEAMIVRKSSEIAERITKEIVSKKKVKS
jgi:hypothetical protein